MTFALLEEKASYTFSDYFALAADAKEVLAHFGYSLRVQTSQLPRFPLNPERTAALQERINESLPHISLNNETARREFLIAPVLLEVVHYTQAWLRVEYPLLVNDQLKGTLDYYLEAESGLLVVEAKNADLVRGFTQLAVEMIALNNWIESDSAYLYGAVSVGDIWRFGILDRQHKQMTQDLNLYRVPTDLPDLLATLVAILKGIP